MIIKEYNHKKLISLILVLVFLLQPFATTIAMARNMPADQGEKESQTIIINSDSLENNEDPEESIFFQDSIIFSQEENLDQETENQDSDLESIFPSLETNEGQSEELEADQEEILTDSNPIIETEIETETEEEIVETEENLLQDLEENLLESPEDQSQDPAYQDENTENKILSADQEALLENLQPGQGQIISLGKTSYIAGQSLDLRDLLILTKTPEGQGCLFDYQELISNPEILIYPSLDQKLAANYYQKLLDPIYLADEAPSFKEKLENYLRENPIESTKLQLRIQIPGIEPLSLDLEVKEENLNIQPIELFKALRTKNSSIIVLDAGKLSYTNKDQIDLAELRFLIKDENGNLWPKTGQELLADPNFHIDMESFERAKEKLDPNYQVQLQNFDPAWYIENFRSVDLFSVIQSQETEKVQQAQEHKEIQTTITVEGLGYENLYLPITISNDKQNLEDLEEYKNASIRTSGKLLDENLAQFKIVIDINKLSAIKDLSLNFLDGENQRSDNIRIQSIIKTDGYREEDISLTDYNFRDLADVEDIEGYKTLDPIFLQEDLGQREILNPLSLATKLDPGYKYIITVEMERMADQGLDLEADWDLNNQELISNLSLEEHQEVQEQERSWNPQLLIQTRTRLAEDLRAETDLGLRSFNLGPQAQNLEESYPNIFEAENIVEKEILVAVEENSEKGQLELGEELVEEPLKEASSSFQGKKFHLANKLNFKASIEQPIPKDWYFDINIGPYLKVGANDLEPIKKADGTILASLEYIVSDNIIRYSFQETITEDFTVAINQMLDFNPEVIGSVEKIRININLKGKNMASQTMFDREVLKGEDSPVTLKAPLIVDDSAAEDNSSTTYPYSLPYESKQDYYYSNGGRMRWTISIDTSELLEKKDLLDYNNLGLALYAPSDQGLRDYNYKISIDGNDPLFEGQMESNNALTRKALSLKKNDLGNKINIEVTASIEIPANTYSLGLRLTPDENYLMAIVEEVQAKIDSIIAGSLGFVIPYIKNLEQFDKFKNGFNLIDVRLTTSNAPRTSYDQYVSTAYGDTTRSMFGKNLNEYENYINFTVSDTLRLEEINDKVILNSLGDDVYKRTFTNASEIAQVPAVQIFTPNADGTYTVFYDDQISDSNALRESLPEKLLPGTIIQYTWKILPQTPGENSQITVDFQNRTIVDGLGQVGGPKTASFRKRSEAELKEGYHIGYQTRPIGAYGEEWKAVTSGLSSIMRVVENYEMAWCINWGIPDPVGEDFWPTTPNDGLKIIRREIKSGADLFPFLPASDGVLDGQEKNPEKVYEQIKKAFYVAHRYGNELGLYNDLDVFESNDNRINYNKLDVRYEDVKYHIRAYYTVIGDYIGKLTTSDYEKSEIWLKRIASTQYPAIRQDFNEKIDSISDDEWNQVKDYVELIAYTNHKNQAGLNLSNGENIYQNLITGKVYDPIEISKVDEEGKPLQGAEFQLIKNDGSPNGSLITTWESTGEPKLVYLGPGSYTLKETKAPKGRKPIDPYNFEIIKDQETLSRQDSIPLQIVDKINNLDNSFRLGYNALETKKDFYQISDLAEAQKELNSKAHFRGGTYIKDVLKISSNSDNDKVQIKQNEIFVENPKTANVRLKKTDENGILLPGAKFRLEKLDGTFVDETISGEDGMVIFTGLSKGNYTIIETEAPKDYKKLDYAFALYVNDQGVVYISEIPLDQLYSLESGNRSSIESLSSEFITHRTTAIKSVTNNQGITVKDYNLYVNRDPQNEVTNSSTVFANKFDSLSMEVTFDVADLVKSGDSFEIDLDDKIQPLGLIPTLNPATNRFNPPVLKVGDKIVATGEYDNIDNKIVYTFTSFVDKFENVELNLQLNGMGPNRDKIQNTGKYTFTNKVADENKTDTFYIDYSGIYDERKDFENYMSIKNMIPEWHKSESKVTQVIYLNPKINSRGPWDEDMTRLYYYDNNIENNPNLDIANSTVTVYKVPGNLKESVMVDSMKPNINAPGVEQIQKEVYSKGDQAYLEFPASDFHPKNVDVNYNSNGYIVILNVPTKSVNKDIDMGFKWEEYRGENTEGVWIKGHNEIKVFGDGGSGQGDYIDKIVINNKANGKFEINKVDSDGKVLSGAKFKLTKDGNQEGDIKVSNAEGKIIFDKLTPGTYTLEEVEAPQGYLRTFDTWTVIVDGNGVTSVSKNTAEISNQLSQKESMPKPTMVRSFSTSPLRSAGQVDAKVIADSLITNIKLGKSTISTNAIYNPSEDNFKVTVDITAGEDTVTGSEGVDVVFIIPNDGYIFWSDIKEAIVNKIDSFGDKTKISVIIYDSKLGYKWNSYKSYPFQDKNFSKEKIQNYGCFNDNSLSDIHLENAFKIANDLFENNRTNKKVLVNLATKSIGAKTSLKGTLNSFNSNVEFINLYVGQEFDSDRPSYNNYPRLSNLIDASLGDYNTIIGNYESEKSLKVINEEIPQCGVIKQKDIDQGQIILSLNSNFVYLGDTETEWEYDTNLQMPSKEITLNAGESKSLSFTVSNLPKDTEIDLVEGISFKPNAQAESYLIKSPRVRIYEKRAIKLTNTHTGQGTGTINGELYRSSDNGLNWAKVQDLNLALNSSITENLSIKDDSGNPYSYKFENIKTEAESIIIDTPSIEIGQLTTDRDIEILSHYDDNQRKIVVESQHMGIDGRPLSLVLQAVEDPTFRKEFTLNTNETTSLIVPDKDPADKKYNYYLSVKEGSLPEDIKFKGITYPDGKIVISTEFMPKKVDLKITNFNEGTKTGSLKAILLCKDLADFSLEINLETGETKNYSVQLADEAGKEFNYYLAINPGDLPTGIALKGIEKNPELDFTIKTVDKQNFTVGLNWKGVEPKGTITLNFKNGDSITLDSNSDYFYNSDEEGLEIQSIIGTEGEYNYSYNGENGNYIITVTDKAEPMEVPVITVVNKKAVYPATGGMGTLVFSLVGSGLMGMSLLGLRKKKDDEDLC
ncbi:MAG: SpaA isopeptide-forming pilin-related protein [Bacillota bacterium]|nr:SpaA isopeptide-forming pilin-related protein [Bacillota bacterium]